MSTHEFDDRHALAGAYALDAVNDEERAEFEQHLADCADCRAEVADLRAAGAELSASASTPPPAQLREQVLRQIASVPQLPRTEPTTTVTPVTPIRPARRRWNRWLAAAAAVVLLGGGAALAVTQPWKASQTQNDIAAQVQQAPDAQRYQQTLADGSTVTVVRSPSVGRAVLVTQNLATPPNGQTYQMWLQASGGNFVSAGLVPPGPNQTVVLEGDAATAKGAGVSVEPGGGSAQPTTTPIALFAFT
jgi:anti-sigma-K factor RskA